MSCYLQNDQSSEFVVHTLTKAISVFCAYNEVLVSSSLWIIGDQLHSNMNFYSLKQFKYSLARPMRCIVLPQIIAGAIIIIFSPKKGAIIWGKAIIRGRLLFQTMLPGSRALNILSFIIR